MSSGRESADAASDGAPEFVCDRCGDVRPADRVIRLSSEPCPALADRYDPVVRTWCADCVAGIGLLAFSVETRARPPVEPE
ncbi:hypothetical protein [Natrarchaeobius oligotrophus]|nr:hypothetical protein [Natrarchaeobius chitinivorans]